jgi:hypothetical protein
MSESKPRHLTVDAHILAYLGDYVTMLEESVKRLALEEIKKQQTNSVPSLMPKEAESVPADLKYTASSRSHS